MRAAENPGWPGTSTIQPVTDGAGEKGEGAGGRTGEEARAEGSCPRPLRARKNNSRAPVR